ncbi:hypothetical protein CIG75_01685 [Tumebacillus algifaecis]|uniref:Uncharacterized protein n=1 Tax=Tumebacillus algifaecis TaxID=1214604 RepID=A0A223CWT7_9BACL|nr:hypothetical protein [Tumebacillus algifaecis]ASS73809.1 hypothetical protein CIG75_01685 [Tumebacillus algifaecis]
MSTATYELHRCITSRQALDSRQEALHFVYSTLQSVMEAEQHPRLFYQDLNGRNIRQLFDTVLQEMKSKLGLLLCASTMYASDGFLYHHSVNVALVALAIRHRIRLARTAVARPWGRHSAS